MPATVEASEDAVETTGEAGDMIRLEAAALGATVAVGEKAAKEAVVVMRTLACLDLPAQEGLAEVVVARMSTIRATPALVGRGAA